MNSSGIKYGVTVEAALESTDSSLACGRVLNTKAACSALLGRGMSSTYIASPETCTVANKTLERCIRFNSKLGVDEFELETGIPSMSDRSDC